MIEGIGIQVNGNIQAAIDQAGARYRARFGQAPTHVSLPGNVDPATVNTYTLQIERPTSGTRRTKPGTVIVGREVLG